ncbi:MAG: polymer-forming cytoskeletal protein, partial [Clostridiales bacterium]|nr:polymer-forming cytoskeletal protein [Clostridiales bacterium]
MGFFSDLKEDLSQAVNELVPEDGAEAVDAESAAAPETTDDLGKMLDDMDLDGMLADMPAADEEEKNVHSAPVTEHAVESPKGSVSDETGIITSGMTIHGDISSQGSMDVIGSIVGNVDILGKLKVTGAIDGDSHAAEIYAEKAHINGEVKSEGSVKIGPDTIIIGNIFATSAVIAGAVKGDIDVKG